MCPGENISRYDLQLFKTSYRWQVTFAAFKKLCDKIKQNSIIWNWLIDGPVARIYWLNESYQNVWEKHSSENYLRKTFEWKLLECKLSKHLIRAFKRKLIGQNIWNVIGSWRNTQKIGRTQGSHWNYCRQLRGNCEQFQFNIKFSCSSK